MAWLAVLQICSPMSSTTMRALTLHSSGQVPFCFCYLMPPISVTVHCQSGPLPTKAGSLSHPLQLGPVGQAMHLACPMVCPLGIHSPEVTCFPW